MSKRRKNFTPEFLAAVIRHCGGGELTVKEIALALRTSPSRIYWCIEKYGIPRKDCRHKVTAAEGAAGPPIANPSKRYVESDETAAYWRRMLPASK